MRRVTVILVAIALLTGLNCRDNPVEEPPVIPAAIVLSANYPSIIIGGETSGIYAHILAENGDTLGAGYEIRFEITDAPATSGPGSPSFEYIASEDSVLLEVAAVTNSSGRASTMLYSGTEVGNVTIKATYAGNDNIFAEETLITLLPVPTNRIILSSEYAAIPYGGVSTQIYAIIENQNGDTLGEGYTIEFEIIEAPATSGPESPSFEYVASADSVRLDVTAITDSSGRASTTLYSGTDAGDVVIRATYTDNDEIFAGQSTITILPVPLNRIILTLEYETIPPGGASSLIHAVIEDQYGDTLGEGFTIEFEITEAPATSGPESPSFEYIATEDSVLLEVTAITNSDGRASTILYSGTETGEVTIRATFINGDLIFVEEFSINIISVPLNRIILSSEYTTIPHGGASTRIYATIEDQNGDPAGDGHEVRFEIAGAPSFDGEESPSFEYQATEDSALHLFETVTNINGQASTSLYSGTLPGIVHIKASVASDTTIFHETPLVEISTDNIYYIELSVADTAFDVGGDTATIIATLFDWHDTPAGEGYDIELKIVDAFHSNVLFVLPGGNDSILVCTTDVNGQVSGVLQSGNKAGPVVIRATTLFDTSIYVEESVVRILAGPPYHIDIFPFGAVDIEDGVIVMEIAAAVWDQYTNPVEPLTRVDFELLPDTIGYIESPAYTGGWIDPDTGDTVGVRGLAITWAAYSCYHTFDTIRIIAASNPIVDTSSAIILPFYPGSIAIDATPGVLYISPPDTAAFADVEAQLLDGFG